jgi:hypothetical protein
MKKIFLLAVLLIIASSQAFPQGLKIGAGGGLSMVQSPDLYTKSLSDGGFGFGTEYHVGVKAVVDIPLVPLLPVGYINYHFLEGDVSQKILTVGLGVNYNLISGPLTPYLTLDLQYNNFGETQQGAQTFGAFSRTGLGIGAGAAFSLLPLFDLDVTAKYNMLNLMGKKEGEETVSIITLSAMLMFGF